MEDQRFREFVAKLDPTYVIPTRKVCLTNYEGSFEGSTFFFLHEEEKQKATLKLQNVTAVSLTSDMWTSINMDLTCHYIDNNTCLKSTLLGVVYFPLFIYLLMHYLFIILSLYVHHNNYSLLCFKGEACTDSGADGEA